MKAFVIDVNHCTSCYACQIACKDEHSGNDWTPYAKPQPDSGHFWGKLNYSERGQIPQVRVTSVFVPCQHCADAPCAAACAPKAINTRSDGLVLIDPKKCTGCQACLDACPYGAIYYNAQLEIAQKCTGCAHLVDRKAVFAPRCADACPQEAIKFGEEADLASLISKAEKLQPNFGAMPKVRVYYLGLPKRFVAGTVYDPGAKEVVVGATCTLTGQGGPFTATTDNFGDFWLNGLPPADFTLKIEKAGKSVSMNVSTKTEDKGLGDIALA